MHDARCHVEHDVRAAGSGNGSGNGIGGEAAVRSPERRNPRGSDAGLGQVRYVLVRHGDRACFFNLLSDGPDRDRRIEVLIAAARTFHTLSNAEASQLRPYRLRVIPSAGVSAVQLAQRLPYDDFRMERLLLLNGVMVVLPKTSCHCSAIWLVAPTLTYGLAEAGGSPVSGFAGAACKRQCAPS